MSYVTQHDILILLFAVSTYVPDLYIGVIEAQMFGIKFGKTSSPFIAHCLDVHTTG
jgi:hypothetical protein